MHLVRLHHMVNQIARNLAVRGDEAATAATVDHLKLFWDPRMKAAIIAGDRNGLEPIAQAAVERLERVAGIEPA